MRILFDQGTPVPLRDFLRQHEVATAFERGWSELRNGELLDTAEREGFAVFLTTDSKLKFQQNLGGRRIANSRAPVDKLAADRAGGRHGRERHRGRHAW